MATVEYQFENSSWELPIMVSILPTQKDNIDKIKNILKDVLNKLNGLTKAQNTILLFILFDILCHNEEKEDVQRILMSHLRSHITCINLGEFRIICEKLCHLIVLSINWNDSDRIHLESKINKFISIF